MEPNSSHSSAILGPPRQISCYSVTPKGVEFNISSLRSLVPPPLGANLRDGLEPFESLHKNEIYRPQRLDNVLLACLQPEAKEQLLKVDIVIRRGVLVRYAEV